jgi:type I restriction enzyme M protein
MPSNIFATTGTNVSVLFIDKANVGGKVVLFDATKMGEERNDGEKKRRYLSKEDEHTIIDAFKSKTNIEDRSIILDYGQLTEKNYSLSAGQYFDVKIKYVELSREEFNKKIHDYKSKLNSLFDEGNSTEDQIINKLEALKYED